MAETTEFRLYTHDEIKDEAIQDLGVDPQIFLLLDTLTDDQRSAVFGAYCRVCGRAETGCQCRRGLRIVENGNRPYPVNVWSHTLRCWVDRVRVGRSLMPETQIDSAIQDLEAAASEIERL